MRIFVVPILLLSVVSANIESDFVGIVGAYGPFDRICSKHADCEKGFPEEWCGGTTSDGKRKCVIMRPIKQTCTQDSECPKPGEECYKKRCVESVPTSTSIHHFIEADDLPGHRHNFAQTASKFRLDAPPPQKCTVSTECLHFPRKWCMNNLCLWKPPGTRLQFSGIVGSYGPFDRICTKHSDCEKGFPEEWCRGTTSDGKRKCSIMPPIKQTCTQDSECSKPGEECYKKRCVESVPATHHYLIEADDLPANRTYPPRSHREFTETAPKFRLDTPPPQKCTVSTECLHFPRKWCMNNLCLWKPPGTRLQFSGIVGSYGPFDRICTKHADCEKGFPEEWCRGTTSDGKRKCSIMPPIKQTCTQDSECPKPGEECYKKRCVESVPTTHHHYVVPHRHGFSDDDIIIVDDYLDPHGFPRNFY